MVYEQKISCYSDETLNQKEGKKRGVTPVHP